MSREFLEKLLIVLIPIGAIGVIVEVIWFLRHW